LESNLELLWLWKKHLQLLMYLIYIFVAPPRTGITTGYKNILVLRFLNITLYHDHSSSFKYTDFQVSRPHERQTKWAQHGIWQSAFPQGPIEVPNVDPA
jgi:hypothetical protein